MEARFYPKNGGPAKRLGRLVGMAPPLPALAAMKVYIDKNDWWVGVYRGPNHWYVCLLPTVVLRLRRKNA